MIAHILTAVVLVSSGIAAGVLFTHAVGVWPAMQAMTPDRYVAAHKLLGRAYDPMMPIIVSTSLVLDVILFALSENATSRFLYATSAIFLAGVGVVSQTRNVPINRRVKALDPDAIPADWDDPRGIWGKWNLLRTTFAVLALVGNAAAAVSAG
ncbi:anthrone oxygenase family protein [Nonomuraea sp. NPDC047897]|uniref:anthrone oxygenase family protein n=1 Tax=Nonomuraea sp. NPDC047897 TaxID=3364346 RepID=UPI003717A9AD